MNDRQQVVFIVNGKKTVQQGPFTQIIWPSTRPMRRGKKCLLQA